MGTGQTPRRRLATLLLVLGAGLSVAASEELPFFHITPENQFTPLPSASVQKVIQDSQGFIWMGFYSTGLARFDGRSFESFGTQDGLGDLTLREMLQDDRGYLWAGTESSLVVSDRPLPDYGVNEKVRFVDRVGETLLRRGRIRHACLARGGPGEVWVGTGSSAVSYHWEGAGRLRERVYQSDPGPGEIRSWASAIIRTNDGSVLLGLLDGRILLLRPGSSRLEDVPGTSDPLLCLHQRGSGAVWAGFGSGAVGVWHESPVPRFEIVSRLLTERVVEMRERADGALWVVSLGDGMLLYDPATRHERHITRREGLISNTMWSVLEDREGSTWFGQNGGVSRLRANFHAFGRLTGQACADGPPDLPDPAVFATLPARGAGLDSLMWVATSGGLTAIAADGSTTTIAVAEGLASKTVYGLARDRHGRIWAATVNGLNVLSPNDLPPPLGEIEQIQTVKVANQALHLAHYPTGLAYTCTPIEIPTAPGAKESAEIMVVSGIRGVTVFAANRWFVLRGKAGVQATGATCSAIDGPGHLCIGTLDSGLLRSAAPVAATSFTSLESAGDVSPDREVTRPFVHAPAWDADSPVPAGILSLLRVGSRLWVGTEVGLLVIEGEKPRVLQKLDRTTGLGGSTVRGMARSPRSGAIWVSQGAGLAELDPASGTVRRLVNKSDGLVDNEAWAHSAVSAAEDGTILLGTPKGLSLYRPEMHAANPVPPRIAIRRASLLESPGRNEVVMEFAALSFTDETRVLFRTRLRGYDPDWSPASHESKIRYTNLPAVGWSQRYVFEVTAANGDGVWAESPLRYPLTISPPPWLTWWAFLAYTLSLGWAVVSFIHWRTSSLARHAAELEAEVGRRTGEIQAQSAELQTLERIVRLVNREVSLERVQQALLDHGLELFPAAEKALFVSWDRRHRSFQVKAAHGWTVDAFGAYSLSHEDVLRRYTEGAEKVQEGVFLVRDFKGRPGGANLAHLETPKAMLSMTVTIEDRIDGFIVFDNFTTEDAFDNSDLRRLSLFRQHAISAIQKARTVADLEDASRDARQASEAKSAFLANMSHELRTPLNSIIGFSEILQSRIGSTMNPRFAKFLDNINASGQHLLGIINDILDLSKVEAGRMEMIPDQVSIAEIIEGVATVMRPQLRQKGMGLSLDVEPNLPRIEADPIKLKQVLYNLMSNAVKFSPGETAVTVRAAAVAADSSPLGVDGILLAVEDRGIGIAQSDQERVFEEFVQADSSLRRVAGGTGLGLALVKRFVEMHGGVVQLDSSAGSGSTFSVYLRHRLLPQ